MTDGDELVVRHEFNAHFDDGCNDSRPNPDQKTDDPASQPLPPHALHTSQSINNQHIRHRDENASHFSGRCPNSPWTASEYEGTQADLIVLC